MADRLVLHIGTQKSGSTYLQRLLHELAPTLPADLVYPIGLGRNPTQFNHEYACYPVLYPDIPYIKPSSVGRHTAKWEDLQTAVAIAPDVALVSGEAICLASEKTASDLVEQLGVPRVEVIITARDLGSVITSAWQQLIRNGRPRPLDGFLNSWMDSRGPGTLTEQEQRWEADPSLFRWREYAIGSLAARWQRVVGADHVTVVTVPPPGSPPTELWSRFREATGLQPDLPAEPPALGERASNVGITEPETIAYLDILALLHNDGVRHHDRKWLVDRTIESALLPRADDRGRRPKLPEKTRSAIEPYVQEDVERLRQTGARIVGDINDLSLRDSSFAVEPVPVSQVNDAMAHIAAELTRIATAVPEPPLEQA